MRDDERDDFEDPELLDDTLRRPVQRAAKDSGLAWASLGLGLLSAPGMICLCIPTFITGLGAVITGHMALAGIRNSGGRLAGQGKATTGLVLGYGFLLIAAAWWGFTIYSANQPRPQVAVDDDPARDAFKAAERRIATDSGGTFHGNTPEAKELARRFSETMEKVDAELFTETNAKLKLSGGHYVTWCELHAGKCAFVVHVPEYRRFEKEAKEALATVAWKTAQSIVSDSLQPGDELAVGLKGVLLYGSVMTGVVESEGAEDGLDDETTDEDDLIYYFEKPEPAEDEPLPEMPEDNSLEAPKAAAEKPATPDVSAPAEVAN